jgi:GNAT superfamily N-acetyltransferase
MKNLIRLSFSESVSAAHRSNKSFPMPSLSIRRAMKSDAEKLVHLTSLLGYPSSLQAIEARLARILASAEDCLLVADDSSGELVGWIHGFLSQLLESDYRVEIGGLVVDERYRRIGVGRRLVEGIEAWAKEHGAFELSVRCREERTESHKFYERLLFRQTKTQRVFRKRV